MLVKLMTRRWQMRYFFSLLFVGLSACNTLSPNWEDLIETGYNAYQDGRYEEAESLLLEALRRSNDFPETDLRRVTTLTTLAELYLVQSRQQDTETLYRQALTILEQTLDGNDFRLTVHLIKMAEFYLERNILSEAESLYERAVLILERDRGEMDIDLAIARAGLADTYYQNGFFSEAEPLLQQSLAVLTNQLDPNNAVLANLMAVYAELLRATDRGREAANLEARVRAIETSP